MTSPRSRTGSPGATSATPDSARRPVRIAFSVQPQHADWAQLRASVVAAEEAGADLITIWDHFFPLFGNPDGKHFEAWTALAAWAEATSRVIPVGPEGYGPELHAAGATLFNVRCTGPTYDLGPLREWLAWRDELNPAHPPSWP